MIRSKARSPTCRQAQGTLDAWEKVNRELLLEKERIDLRRDEVLRQVDQAGRRAEEFRDGSLADAVAAGSERFAGTLRTWNSGFSACAAIWRASARWTTRS